MARVADHVYDHLLAVCRSAPAARSAAVEVLGRAPRSLGGALAVARVRALEVAPGTAEDSGGVVPGGLLELTWLLAGTRPVGERSVADLAVRHGLDRAGLGRALGTAPARAAADADAVLERWDRALRPAVVAFLGPGDCDGLHAVLVDAGVAAAPPPATAAADGGRTDPGADGPADAHEAVDAPEPPGPPTVGVLLAAAPAVAEHLDRCTVCPDRVRAMPSVRSLLAQVPIAVAPPGLQAAPWRRRPVRASVTASPTAGRRRHRARRWVAAGVVSAAVAAGAAAVVALAGHDGEDEVAVLTRLPARNALAVVPDEIRPGQVFLLESTGDRPVRWRVRRTEPWVVIEPPAGALEPGQATEVEVSLADAAPEGPLRLDLTVTGDDGSTVLVRLRGSVEHPPAVAATADGCAVTAQVEDESEVATVDLHWRDDSGATGSRPMAAATAGYRAAVPAAAGPVRWWVSAVDGRGNRARSAEHALASC